MKLALFRLQANTPEFLRYIKRHDMDIHIECLFMIDPENECVNGDRPGLSTDLKVYSLGQTLDEILSGGLDGVCVVSEFPGADGIRANLQHIRYLLDSGFPKKSFYIAPLDMFNPDYFKAPVPLVHFEPMDDLPPRDIAVVKTSYDYLDEIFLLFMREYYPTARIPFLCSNLQEWVGKTFCDREVVSFAAAKNAYDAGAVDGVLLHGDTHGFENSTFETDLAAVGINRVSRAPVTTLRKTAHTQVDLEKISYSADRYAGIDVLDLLLTKHCNLNCAGCTVFGSLQSDEKFYDSQALTRDLHRIRELVGYDVRLINFLGGEPLLHPDLTAFITLAAELFPYSSLRINTNGLLLRSIPTELAQAIARHRVNVSISLYPPLFSQREEIESFCRDRGFAYDMVFIREHFCRKMNLHGKSDRASSYRLCGMNRCSTLFDGTIAACGAVHGVAAFNRSFFKNIPYENDLIDIHDPGLNGGALGKRLRSPLNLCAYCTLHPLRYREWHQVSGFPDISDWVGDI